MFKSFLAIIALSVAVIFFRTELIYALHGLLYLHSIVANWLASIFSQGTPGKIMQSTAGLMLVPILIGAAVAFVLWAAKREYLKFGIATTWFIWTVLLVALLTQRA